MNAKVVVGIVLVALGIVLIGLGVQNALFPVSTCILLICVPNPFAWVPGAVSALVGLVLVWLGVRVL